MVCDIAIAAPNKFAYRNSVGIGILHVDNFTSRHVQRRARIKAEFMVKVLQGKGKPAQVLGVAPVKARLRRNHLHVFK